MAAWDIRLASGRSAACSESSPSEHLLECNYDPPFWVVRRLFLASCRRVYIVHPIQQQTKSRLAKWSSNCTRRSSLRQHVLNLAIAMQQT